MVLEKQTNRRSRPVALLQEEYQKHRIEYFDENPRAVIQGAVDELASKFSGLEIKKTRVHEFMKNECNLTVKTATFWLEAKNSEEKFQKRVDCVVIWSLTDMGFFRNCAFIDESGFNINLNSSRAWAPKGESGRAISY